MRKDKKKEYNYYRKGRNKGGTIRREGSQKTSYYHLYILNPASFFL
jgi:hypothetical protein